MSDAAASDTVLTDGATATPDASTATNPDATTATAAPDTLLTGDDAKPATTDDATKTDDPAKADDKGDDAKKEEQKGAPEEYEAFKLPDTFKVDEPVMGEFKTLAKELGLSQEAAQKLVDLQAKQQAGNATAFTETLQAHVDKTAKEWAATAKADPEYGGVKFDENVGIAKQALDTFGTPELKALLNESRLGSHPEVIRFMVKAGKAISQDGFVPGRASASTPKADHDVFYSTSTANAK